MIACYVLQLKKLPNGTFFIEDKLSNIMFTSDIASLGKLTIQQFFIYDIDVDIFILRYNYPVVSPV